MNKTNKAKAGKKIPRQDKPVISERGKLLSEIWGKRKVSRLNRIIDKNFCGVLTVREFVAIVLADHVNFPRGIDTWLAIGDFEGNFCTNVLGVTVGGRMSDHVCLTGDNKGYGC